MQSFNIGLIILLMMFGEFILLQFSEDYFHNLKLLYLTEFVQSYYL